MHFLTRFVEFMRRRMDVHAVEQESPKNFLDRLANDVAIDGELRRSGAVLKRPASSFNTYTKA